VSAAIVRHSWKHASLVLFTLGIAATCEAQVYLGQAAPHKGSVELSGGGTFQGGKDLPDQTATLTRNPPTGTGPFELFRADSTLNSALGLQARLGYYLSSALSLEGGVQIARPTLEVHLSDDAEGAEEIVASESITSYLFTGSVLYHFGSGAGLRPFLAAGAGHVRDLHSGNEVVETGLEYHAGGGVKSWFGGGRSKLGFRAEVLLSIRDGGFAADDERRLVPTAAFSLAYLF
jgi:hypothetical protein